jgi:hypothetical protein
VTGLSVGDCVAIWNGAANADVRSAAAAMRPRQVYVGVLEMSVGIVSTPPPPRCAVFLRDPGGGGAPPSMLTIPMAADGTRFDLTRATRHEGADNTALGHAPEAVLADEGTISLRTE